MAHRKCGIALIVLLLLAQAAAAQVRQITGRVTNTDGARRRSRFSGPRSSRKPATTADSP
jgi:hypothetical protein